LRVLAQALVAVVGGATAADPAEGGSWTTRLREHLAGAGVRTDEDLLWLIRLGVRPDRYPLLGVMRRAGVSLELLAALPPGLVREALDAYAARVPDRRPGTRIERYQDRLGIDPRRLLPVLAGNYLERLLFAAAGDLPAAGVGERLRQLLPTAGPAAGEPVADLGEWADRLEVPADRLARALNRPGVDAAELSRLAGRARLAPDGVRNLVELVAETGRVPDDLRWWAYRLRTSPERLAGVGGRLLADPRRLAVLGPVFERIGRLPAGQQPTDGELARMIRDHLRAGQLTGPPSAEAGLWLAGTVPAADGPGLARLPRLLEYEPFAVETARYDHRKALEQLAERLGVLERVSAVPGVAAEPALAGPLTDGIRAVAAARDLLSVLHRPAAVPARAAGSELSAIVDRAAGDLRSARGTRDEPAARTVFLDAARQVTEAVARASTALRDAAGGTDRLHRLYAVTAAGVLDDLRTVFDDGLQAWRLLADGPNAGDWLAAHQPGSGTPVAEGLTADALLATWWSGLTGIPAAVLAPALGPSGWIDPVDLLRLAGPAAALGPGARDLLQSLAIESRIPVRALEPLLGYLRDAGPASAEEISTRLRTLNAALPEALGPPDALGARLSFLADRGLTPADLNDPARAAEEARAWLGDLFGVDAAVAAEMLALPGAGIAAATVIFTDLRGHLTRQGDDPGWEPATFAALATAVDASEPWLLGFSLRTGRVPVEVPDLARQWDVTPVRLFRLAAELGADPRKLSGDPAVVEALRVPGDDRTAVREAARLVRAAGAPEPAAASPARDLATIALRTGRLPGDVVAAAEDLGIGAVELLSVAAPLGAGPGAMAGFLASRLAGDTVVDPTALRALAAGYPAWAGGLKTRFAIAEHEITGLVWAAAEESRTLDYLTRLEPARAASVLRRWRESAAEVDRDTDSTVSDFEFSDAEPDAAPESRQPAPVGLRATGETGDGLDHLVRVVLDSAAQQSVPLPSSVTDVASFWTFLAGRLAEDPAGFADQLPSSVTVAGLLSRLIDPEPAAALALLSADADDLTSPETLRHLRDYYREDGDTPVGRLLDRIERSVSRSGFADLGDMLTALAADPRLRPALAAADPEALIARALRIDLVPVQGGEIVRHTQPRRMPVVHLLRSGPDGWQSLRRDGEAPPLTREQLTRYLGAPMPPGWVRPIELDPPRAAETGAVAADDLDDTHRVMLNAYLMPLADFTPEIFAGRPNAQWNFAVLPDGRIYLGGEGLADLISDAQLRELYLRMSLADPALTWDGLRTALGGRGHPSVTAAFDAAGQARPGPARLAGELLRDRHTGRFYLNDHSGRYMDGRDGWAVRTWLENAAAMISAQVGEPVDVRPYREGDVQPAMRIVEVDTERWTPLRDALRITPAPDGGRPRIDRPVDSGERTAVRYRLTATDRIWYFTLRVSLTGGSEAEREAIRRAVTDGVNRHLTEPGHTLPGSGARMHVDVAFVADDQAHTRITVGDPAAAGQRTWPAHLPPAWYAGQVARHLGVRDARPPETALLRSGPDPVQAYTLTSYTVGSDALGEIAAVLAPHFSGSTASRTPSAATGGHLVDGFWTSGADRPPVSRLDAHGWLLGAGVPADQARRLAADPDLGFHPVHTPALIRRLGLDADGIRRFVDLGEAAGGLTGDELYDAAGELGLAGPAPLYAVSRDLGVPVGMLAPLGEILAGLAIGESGLRPATGTWTGRLIERLRPAGVHDEAGLIWLLRLLDSLEVELDLEESMPGLQRMQEAGLSLELLATLPPALAEQAVDTYLDREAGAASPAGGTRAELWSRRLGFPAEQLRDLLPDPNLEALLHPVLGDVAETRTAAETVAVLGPGQGGPARAEDVTQWAYLLRTDVVVVRDVARALGVPPARLMPLAPVFHRLAALPEGERPTAGRLARIIRDYLRAGTPDGPATVGTALLRARTGLVDLADLTGREVATRQAAYRQILAQAGRIDGARTALAAVIAGAGQPAVATEALSALLADATARIAAVAGAVSALRNGGPLGVDVRAVHADLGRIARALADPPATAGDEVRRVAAAARAAVVTVGDALPRAITAGRRLVAGPTGDQWRELITGARPGPPDHEPADAEREADRVLADWWAERLGIPVADLAPALGRAGWLDPSGLLALARRLNTAPADLFATARRERGLPDDLLTYADRWKVPADLLHRLAADLRVPVRALAPVVPLLTGGTATLPAIKDRIDAAVAGLHDVLGGAGDRRLRLEFLADRGLTVHDLDDTWLVQRSARRWLADVYGMDVDQARTAGPHTLDLAEAVRADRELRHPDKGWSTAAIARTAALLEVSPAWLRGLSVRIGRVPHDLLDLGRPLGPRGAHRLFRLAAELGENPGSLPPEATRPGILDRDGDDRLVVARAAADLRAAVTNGRAFGRPSVTAALTRLATTAGVSPADLIRLARDLSLAPGALLAEAERQGVTDPDLTPEEAAREYRAWLLRANQPGIEVDTERWWPLAEAFRIEPGAPGERPRITRPAGGGELVGVRYRLTPGDQEWTFTVRVHLTAVGDVDLADVRARTLEGVQEHVNRPGYRLPGVDVPMRVAVVFVDDPAQAHTRVRVTADGEMDQRTWPVGQDPRTYAHEVVHGLGARDLTARTGSLLRDTAASPADAGDLMAPLTPTGAVLGPRTLRQIADVLAPHFAPASTPRPEPGTGAPATAEQSWQAGTDRAPLVGEDVDLRQLRPATRGTEELPGGYASDPQLLNRVDDVEDPAAVWADLEKSITDAIRKRVRAGWREGLPGLRSRKPDLSEIREALAGRPKSFFSGGGRSFDVRDGTFHWHRVTIKGKVEVDGAGTVDQSADAAKFDTRLDGSLGQKSSATAGGTGVISFGVTIPQRVGPGGGFGGDLALSRPMESMEAGAKLGDSHNIRGGSGSHLVQPVTRLTVTVTDARGPLTADDAVDGDDVSAPVTFRTDGDIIGATRRENTTEFAVPADQVSTMVENFFPEQILHASLAGDDRFDRSWHDVAEEILLRLAPTKTVEPGTAGASEVRGMLDEDFVL
ncbi:MAG TPA: hypothetical protein VN408_40725, partial [Actinoplanes sp.]|nr:hypothetical protein [Actinoplanes sp.]